MDAPNETETVQDHPNQKIGKEGGQHSTNSVGAELTPLDFRG